MCDFNPQILLAKVIHMVMLNEGQGDEKCHLYECLERGEKLKLLVIILNAN